MNLREFEKWALEQGSVANPDPDNWFKGECVSLIQQYLYQVCGIPFKARGNAKDWANNAIAGWDILDSSNSLKAGDIIVWTSGKYGHIAIIDADMKILEQNRNYNKKITVSDIRKGYTHIQRSRTPISLGEPEQATNGDKTATKSVEQLAKEVIAGGWGNGEDRKRRLTEAGHDYNAVQDKVNEMLLGKTSNTTKTIDELAREVIRGDWGNGADRKNRLTSAGYDYNAVQNRVNQLLK